MSAHVGHGCGPSGFDVCFCLGMWSSVCVVNVFFFFGLACPGIGMCLVMCLGVGKLVPFLPMCCDICLATGVL